jgi:excisionase family DNA binding protein
VENTGTTDNTTDNTAGEEVDLTHAWSTGDVAKYLGCSKRKVMELIGHDDFPYPRRLGARTYRWAPDAIVAWLSSAADVRPRRDPLPRGRHIVERV